MNNNQRHDLTEAQRRRARERAAQIRLQGDSTQQNPPIVTQTQPRPNIQEQQQRANDWFNSQQQQPRRHPDNVRDTPRQGGKRKSKTIRRNRRKKYRKSRKSQRITRRIRK